MGGAFSNRSGPLIICTQDDSIFAQLLYNYYKSQEVMFGCGYRHRFSVVYFSLVIGLPHDVYI